MLDYKRKVIEEQENFCLERHLEHVATPAESKVGYALGTKGKLPVNGLRHPPKGKASGWYIWCGEQFSDADDFFSSIHAAHLYEDQEQVAKLLGLPPGYRFLHAGEYLDVWYDASLLNV